MYVGVPPNAPSLRVDRGGAVLEHFIDRCILCGRCAEVCSKDAAEITREFERVSTNLQELVRRVTQKAARCPLCGRPIGAEAEIESVAEAVRLIRGLAGMCPGCRARLLAKGLVRYYPRRA